MGKVSGLRTDADPPFRALAEIVPSLPVLGRQEVWEGVSWERRLESWLPWFAAATAFSRRDVKRRKALT